MMTSRQQSSYRTASLATPQLILLPSLSHAQGIVWP